MVSDEYLLKIEADGADKSKKQVDALNKSVGNNNSGMTGSFIKAGLAVNLLTKGFDFAVNMGKQLFDTFVDITKQGIQTAAAFEQQMSKVYALSNLSGDARKKLEDLAMQMGKDTQFSALEAAQAIEELIKAGVSLENIMGGGLAGSLSLAAAGSISVAESAEVASTVLNAFRRDNLSVAKAADILAGAANASATDISEMRFGLQMVSAVASGAGMTFKDTATALATFAQNGLKGSDAGTSLKTMLNTLQPTTKKAKEMFQDFGLQVGDASTNVFYHKGQLRSLSDISGELQKKFSKLTDQQRQLAFRTLFGSDAQRAATILYKEGAKGVESMAKAMGEFTAADVAAEKMNNFNGAADMLSSTLETLQIEIFKPLMPTLSRITLFINDLVTRGFNFLRTTIEESRPTIEKIKQELGKLFVELKDAGVIDALGSLGRGIKEAFKQEVKLAIQTVLTLIQSLVKYLKSAEGKKALNDLKNAINTVADAYKTFAGILKEVNRLLQLGNAEMAKGASMVRDPNRRGSGGVKHGGGMISGTPGTDVPMIGQAGEFVIPKEIVDEIKSGKSYENNNVKNINVNVNMNNSGSMPARPEMAFTQLLNNLAASI